MKHFLIAALLLCTLIPMAFADDAVEPFLGRWALELPGGAGWLGVSNDAGYLDASLLWYGGSVVPVDNVYIDGDQLVVTRHYGVDRAKDEDGTVTRRHTVTETFTFELLNETTLAGFAYSPSRDAMSVNKTAFIGNKIPELPSAPDLSKVKFDKKIKLLNGKDLTGWELMGENSVNGWSIVDGALLNNPVQKEGEPHIHYGNIRTVDTFEDFNLTLQVNIPKGNNSGIYLRGIYEVQVFDSYGKDLDSHNMGALYSRITPSEPAEKPAGEWQDVDITLCDRHLTVILNGITIIDNQPVLGCTGGALTSNEFVPGPIYLQGDHGKVEYKNIVLRPIIKK